MSGAVALWSRGRGGTAEKRPLCRLRSSVRPRVLTAVDSSFIVPALPVGLARVRDRALVKKPGRE